MRAGDAVIARIASSLGKPKAAAIAAWFGRSRVIAAPKRLPVEPMQKSTPASWSRSASVNGVS